MEVIIVGGTVEGIVEGVVEGVANRAGRGVKGSTVEGDIKYGRPTVQGIVNLGV